MPRFMFDSEVINSTTEDSPLTPVHGLRLEAKRHEVPIISDEEAQKIFDQFWNLPSDYIRDLLTRSGLYFQLTDSRCTGGCHFCTYSEKGIPKLRFSYQQVFQFMNMLDGFVKEHSVRKEEVIVAFYHDTDPFDHPSYGRIALTFLESGYRVMTSTSIPMGTEERVLEFFNALLDLPKDAIMRSNVRISWTSNNEERLWGKVSFIMRLRRYGITVDMITVPMHLFHTKSRLYLGSVSKVVGSEYYSPLIPRPNGILHIRDLFSVSCNQGLILSPSEIQAVFPVPHSTRYPDGVARFALSELRNKGFLPYPQYFPISTTTNNAVSREYMEDNELSFIYRLQKLAALLNQLKEYGFDRIFQEDLQDTISLDNINLERLRRGYAVEDLPQIFAEILQLWRDIRDLGGDQFIDIHLGALFKYILD